MKVIVTGGCGFVGHHFIEHILKNTDWQIMIFDRLSYAANGLNRVRDINAFDEKRVHFFALDFTTPISKGVVLEAQDVQFLFHLGAETHVDDSIIDPLKFVYANVVGTANLLMFARMLPNLKRFFFFSTDEVFGPASIDESVPTGTQYYANTHFSYKEWDRYNSSNPYAATKAGAEELCIAFSNTYRMPIIITHSMNILGERQHPQKFLPLCINRINNGETVYIHADADRAKSGSRFYIHARNVAHALTYLTDNEDRINLCDKFNIVGEKEVSNLELAQKIAEVLGMELKYELVDFHSSRPGHDLRYALDGTKLEQFGWKIPVLFDEWIEKTVKWYLQNPGWLRSW